MKILFRRFCLSGAILLLTSQIILSQTFTEQTSISLYYVRYGSVVWGDYDNDDDLDILLTGLGGLGKYTKIYRNNGNNTFTEQIGIIPSGNGVYNSSAAWDDYDDDGYLDILLTGTIGGTDYISKIFHNNGDNTFTEQTGISLTGVERGSVAWGDYDNDGKPDILLTGYTGSGSVSKIYRNNGDNTFTEQTGIHLIGVEEGSVAWGDYDHDGDLDILLTGWNNTEGSVVKIYRNNGNNTFTEQTGISASFGVHNSSVAWGDYDNDGYLDILLTGITESEVEISTIFRNNNDNTFAPDFSLTGVGHGSVGWGDYDNDGHLDILLTGNTSSGAVSKIYHNEGDNSFTELTDHELTGVKSSSAAWGDYDNDGDLDIIMTGDSSGYAFSRIYRNDITTPNTNPEAPSNLEAVVSADSVTFTWDMASDTETPQSALTYNVRVGTTSGGSDIVSPMASTSTGYRRIPARGNAEYNYDGFTVHNLEPGTYYWSVQAIDQAFAGGAWAATSSFTIPPDPPVTEAASDIDQTSFTANWSSSTAATGYMLDVAIDNAFTVVVAGYGDLDVGDVTSYSVTGLADFTGYYYRIRAYNEGGISTYSDTMLVVTLHGPDYYVDAADGDNSTGDGTELNPWQTITYTLDNLTGTGRRTIHVAPGTYDNALGEIFPLMMVDSVSMTGNGQGSSIIDAGKTNYVITCSGILDPEMRIEGFTISGGASTGPGGIYISSGSLLSITYNHITDNWAYGEAYGGAIHILNSSPCILNNLITANHGTEIDKGASVYIEGATSAPLISDNTFTGNTNDLDAGGGVVGAGTIVINGSSNVKVVNNIFVDNDPGGSIHGSYSSEIYIYDCSPSITYNLITKSSGNGVYALSYTGSGNPTIINNTISDNAFDGIQFFANPDSIINNIISYNGAYGINETTTSSDPGIVSYNLFYQNSAGLYHDENANIYTSVSTMDADVPECENNLEGDPLFIDRTYGNYHLDVYSPAINTGDPLSELDPDGTRADIGVYYYTPPPDAPMATAATEITYYSFDANWTMSEGASGYFLDVSTDVDFTTFVTGYNSKPVMNESVYTVTGLDHNTVYYYRVRASNYTGSSGNSNIINLATLQVPAPEAPIALDATNIAQTTFSANWEVSDLASGYYLDVALDESFTSFISGFNNKDVGDVTTFAVSGLTPNTDYYYRVRAYNDGGVSVFYSNAISLTTLQVLPPNTPAATAATDITQVSFVANWSASATAEGYYLDAATDGSFTTFVDGFNNHNVGNMTSYEVTGLSSSTTYYYRLRAYNAGGESSNSAVISVKTLEEPPPAPVALEASDTTETSFTANWESAATATGYFLDYTTDVTFFGYSSLDVNNVLSYSLSGLTPNTNYYYRIRAYNNGGIGESSNVITVITLEMPAPDAPVAVNPPYVGQLDFKAAWYMSENATGYFIDVATDDAFTSFVAGYENLDVGDNLNYIIRELTANTTYYYRVRAYNDKGTSDNSNVIIVTTLLNPPDPPPAPTADPPTNVTQTSYTANWTNSDNAVGYELDVATDAQFTNFVEGYEDIGIDNSLSYNVTGLSAGTTYYYRVRAYHLVYTSNNSGTISVTTLPYPPDIPVANNVSALTQTSFKANWETSETATGYYLDVASDDVFTTFVTGYENLDVSNLLSYSITGLTLNTTYYYRIRAYNDGGISGNSNSITVTTLLVMSDVPPAPVADDAENITQTGFTVSWSSIAEAEGYYLDVAYDNAFSSHVTGYYSLDVGNITTFNVSGLQAKTDYYYRVSGYNVSGTGDYSNVITITTLPDPPPPPTGLTASSCNDLVFLSWDQSTETDFDHYTIFVGTSDDDTPVWDTVEDISDPTYTVSGLTNGETYYFRVKTVNTPDVRSDFSSTVSVVVKTGVIPRIKAKWGDVLICYNIGDSLTKFRWYRGSTMIPDETKQYYVTNKQSGSYHVEATDIYGCVNSSNIIDIGSKSLSVYPNPAKSNFTLNLSSKAIGETVVSLYNATGMKVLEYRTEKKETWLNCEIPAGNLKDGIYTIEVIVNNEEINYTRLVIIE